MSYLIFCGATERQPIYESSRGQRVLHDLFLMRKCLFL
ncbi:hypothetical protein GBP346_A2650 [Burkholderia pseudomallei MSHR346]|nr:hypothetical protein GBP346_A2650 [Burkholderia pseudomallei MSHR346]